MWYPHLLLKGLYAMILKRELKLARHALPLSFLSS